MSESLTINVDDGLATIRLGREHGNAINPEMVDALTAAFRSVGDDPAVRGVLFASSGKLFSPGLDLQELILLDSAAPHGDVGLDGLGNDAVRRRFRGGAEHQECFVELLGDANCELLLLDHAAV